MALRGRPLQFPERMELKLPEGATARLDAARHHWESRMDVIRAAIDRELERRAVLPKDAAGPPPDAPPEEGKR